MKKFAMIFILSVFFTGQLVVADEKGGTMKITSPAFEHNKSIPEKYTCEGSDINPSLQIMDIPAEAKSLALIVDDPDAPGGIFVHWVVFDIPVTNQIAEKTFPGRQGINDFGRKKYGGPCPPSGTHRYFFKLYALDTSLNLKEGITKGDLEYAMKGHIVSSAELIGLYQKKR